MTSQLLATMLNNNANAIAKDVPFTAHHLRKLAKDLAKYVLVKVKKTK